MPTTVIAGMGIQGTAIAYAMHRLGYDITGVDIDQEMIENARRISEKLGFEINLVQGDITEPEDMVHKPDILISALPFNFNAVLAEFCIENEIRYCDLGGNIATSERIHSLARDSAKVPVITDLGLAPGIANIIAEMAFESLGRADSVRIRVGGLPVEPAGLLKYSLTFSPQGLYNEYFEECYAIRDSKKVTLRSLTEIEKLSFDETGEMEAFLTSGGIATTLDMMLANGVTECDYKTIRFPGHCEIIRFLLFEMKIPKEVFERGMVEACGFTDKDQVLIAIDVESKDNSRTLRSRILHDQNFTAMQKTTGFGTAAVASIMGKGMMDGVKAARYSDIPRAPFAENLGILIPEIDLSGLGFLKTRNSSAS